MHPEYAELLVRAGIDADLGQHRRRRPRPAADRRGRAAAAARRGARSARLSHRVLVGFAGGEPSLDALALGGAIAAATGGHILALHVQGYQC